MAKKSVFIIGLILCVGIYIYWGNKATKRDARIRYSEFNAANLDGKIDKASIAYKAAGFKLENNTKTFVFHPITSSLNGNHIFVYFAKSGDRVVKPAYSDTLKLIRGNEVYLYTFHKFELNE